MPEVIGIPARHQLIKLTPCLKSVRETRSLT